MKTFIFSRIIAVENYNCSPFVCTRSCGIIYGGDTFINNSKKIFGQSTWQFNSTAYDEIQCMKQMCA